MVVLWKWMVREVLLQAIVYMQNTFIYKGFPKVYVHILYTYIHIYTVTPPHIDLSSPLYGSLRVCPKQLHAHIF